MWAVEFYVFCSKSEWETRSSTCFPCKKSRQVTSFWGELFRSLSCRRVCVVACVSSRAVKVQKEKQKTHPFHSNKPRCWCSWTSLLLAFLNPYAIASLIECICTVICTRLGIWINTVIIQPKKKYSAEFGSKQFESCFMWHHLVWLMAHQ